MIKKWKSLLSLNDWTFNFEEINPSSVEYDNDCPSEERYFIGIEVNRDLKIGTIYHDRELTERDIIHELLHVRYPKWTEDQVNDAEELLYKINKDEN